MSIAILNWSGNVGKTTITRELLAPRLQDMTVRQIESINTDESNGAEVEVMIAARFDELHEELMLGRDLLVDIGASNVEEYLDRLEDSDGAQEDYAFFVVPVVPAKKQVQDTLKTINRLTDLGVESTRIRVLLNMVELSSSEPVDRTLARQFDELIRFHGQAGGFCYHPDALVPKSDIFSIAAEAGITIHDIVENGVDYKAQLAAAQSDVEKRGLVRLIGLRRKAISMTPQLDRAFGALMSGVTV
ncbi:StbB family protein [Burkholderia alba]|uniref:StbB family protein n=1 Tax=Burkholderia alba TaxID=2683677 RepID=UPI002B0538DD|nr:StbB family protein [Burkholderia alba]